MECKPKTKAEIEKALRDSIREEEVAQAAYDNRQKDAPPAVKKVYRHILKDEREHKRELKAILKKV